ncbi:hypothetical protein JHK86_022685 [Glycine max]|nr:hypothetical protein JHK86_022685 [Glycine max]
MSWELGIQCVGQWLLCIQGLALHRKSIELVELFSEMLMERVRRNGITFVGVLNGYSHGGLVDLAIYLASELHNLAINIVIGAKLTVPMLRSCPTKLLLLSTRSVRFCSLSKMEKSFPSKLLSERSNCWIEEQLSSSEGNLLESMFLAKKSY